MGRTSVANLTTSRRCGRGLVFCPWWIVENHRVLVSIYFTTRWTLSVVPTFVFGWFGTVKTELVSKVPSFSKVKLMKLLTIIEIARLGPVEGTGSWLGCSRGDLTLRSGKWPGVFYGLVSFWTSCTITIAWVESAVTGKDLIWPLELCKRKPLWEGVTGGLAAFLWLPLTGSVWEIRNVHSLCMECKYLYQGWKWRKRILVFSLLKFLSLVRQFTLEPTWKFFHQTLQFGRVPKHLGMCSVASSTCWRKSPNSCMPFASLFPNSVLRMAECPKRSFNFFLASV